MCDIKHETSIAGEIRLARTALMGSDLIIPGAEDEALIPDKYVYAAHSYEHMGAAYDKAKALGV